MGDMSAASIRARVRAEMIDEIKTTARRHLAGDGANLSLRAVARDLGMVSSAIYRYFPSRDELLTALIIDAYNAVGEVVEQASASLPREQLEKRWLAVCHGVRDWALDRPYEYGLVYGTPVPGYKAPVDTVEPATRTTFAILRLLADGVELGLVVEKPPKLPATVAHDLKAVERFVPGVPEPIIALAAGAWTLLFGAVSFELNGQFDNVITDRRAFYDVQMRQAIRPLLR
jgi:AcrR family transcriptional regulator